jgi:hypothetical protein
MTDTQAAEPQPHTHTLEIHYYPEPLGSGRGIMRVDIVQDGTIVDTHESGSPAPMATLERYAHTHRSSFTHTHARHWLPSSHPDHPPTEDGPPADISPFWSTERDPLRFLK